MTQVKIILLLEWLIKQSLDISFLEDLKLSIFTDQSYRWDWDYSLSPLVILSVRFANSRAETGQWEGIMWARAANQRPVMPPANCNVLSLFSIKTRQVMLRDARNPTDVWIRFMMFLFQRSNTTKVHWNSIIPHVFSTLFSGLFVLNFYSVCIFRS